MYVALQISAALAILSEPFLPFTSLKLKKILEISIAPEQTLTWNDVSKNTVLLKPGHTISQSKLLFSKIEDAQIQQQLEKLEASNKSNSLNDSKGTSTTTTGIKPQKDMITFEDFSKLDIRVGTILEAEKMPKANKLLVLKVDTGLDVRTIVSGIAESFTPEEVVGKKVTVLINLAPRALRGVESQGMILMTENPEGKLVFVNPDTSNVSNGAQIS